ncbi:hypothetical protein [Bacillus cereus]|uniref:hypothetical protein n=1 Tax=Bacillus cereus TaxID=1396 RepID=UPI001F5C6D23|nr:hypothetical protein [Bacillus cereus]
MALEHEFGIINDINNEKTYQSYTPDVHNCISVEDDIIENLLEPLSAMKTYFHSVNYPPLNVLTDCLKWGLLG